LEKGAEEEDFRDVVRITDRTKESKLQSKNIFRNIKDSKTMQILKKEGDSLKDFLRLSSEFLTSQSPEVKTRLDKKRKELMEKGISSEVLDSIEKNTDKKVGQDLLSIMKDAIIKKSISGPKLVQQMLAEQNFKEVMELILEKNQAPDVNFGQNFLSGLKGAMEEAKLRGQKEMQLFVAEELKRKMIERLLDENPKAEGKHNQEVLNLIDFAKKIGFNLSAFLKEWQIDKIDEGLFLLDEKTENVENPEEIDIWDEGREETEELLLNRMRALFMQKAVHQTMKTDLEISFKMRNVKKGLVRLGIYTDDLVNKVKGEAENVAKIKIVEMLQDAFLDRATYPQLAGSSFRLTEKKIEALWKNAEKLGLGLSEMEFRNMLDDANRKIFALTRDELNILRYQIEIVEAQLKSPEYGNKVLPQLNLYRSKAQQMLKLLQRLKEESEIKDSIDEISVFVVRQNEKIKFAA